MIKKLHITLLFLSILLTGVLKAQDDETQFLITLESHDIALLDKSQQSENKEIGKKSVFSYKFNLSCNAHHHEDHQELFSRTISLIDIISSDEEADFNCSGGFCMDKTHFHKKGLTLKRQLFDYFMKISC